MDIFRTIPFNKDSRYTDTNVCLSMDIEFSDAVVTKAFDIKLSTAAPLIQSDEFNSSDDLLVIKFEVSDVSLYSERAYMTLREAGNIASANYIVKSAQIQSHWQLLGPWSSTLLLPGETIYVSMTLRPQLDMIRGVA
jgi:hypothetical protein